MKKFTFLLFFLAACKSPSMDKINPIGTYFDPNLTSVGDENEVIDEYMNLLNQGRVEQGLKPFIYSEDIAREAELHSADMALGRVSFGYEGSADRCKNIKAVFASSNLCGEIVARGSSSPAVVLSSWMKSSSHRAILGSSRYTHTGVSFSKDAEGVAYWTQIFLEVTE